MTAFFERIAEHPAICDKARGADIIDSLTKALGASPELAHAAELLRDEPKVRDLIAGALACAPYLAAIAQRDPALLADCLDPRSRRPSRTGDCGACGGGRGGENAEGGHGRLAPLQAADRASRWPCRSRRRVADGSGAQGHECRCRGCRRSGCQVSVSSGARSRPDRRPSAGNATRLFRHRHGQARRVRAQLFERHRHHRLLRRRRGRASRQTSSRRPSSCG